MVRFLTLQVGILFAVLLPSLAEAESSSLTPETILHKLLPNDTAKGIYKSWKGIKRDPAKKAESKQIPSFTLYVTFEFNSHTLTSDGELLLDQAGLALIDKRLRRYQFFLGGHTDAVGSENYNLELSLRRAQTVRNYLIDKFKIRSDKLIAHGFGESKLLLPDSPEADANRRVEIKNIGPKE